MEGPSREVGWGNPGRVGGEGYKGGGDSLRVEIKQFLGFLVSWLQSFLVSLFQRFKNPLMLLKAVWSILQNFHLIFDRY